MTKIKKWKEMKRLKKCSKIDVSVLESSEGINFKL